MSYIFKPSRDLEPDTACARYLSQAKGWVRDCCETHDRCKDSSSSALPTRVLDVSLDPDFVFLRQSANTEPGSYIALSHVWGGIVPIRTTEETMPLFEDGIRLEDLPQTFRDAVFMTRYLECRYLWIDSLCIVQDSREDWEREAGRMAQVYGNALVTLAAVSSPNSNGGLFSKHDASAVKHTIRRVAGDGTEVIVEVRPALEHTPYYTSSPYGLPPDVNAWLLGRAWCFQGKSHPSACRNSARVELTATPRVPAIAASSAFHRVGNLVGVPLPKGLQLWAQHRAEHRGHAQPRFRKRAEDQVRQNPSK